MNARKSTSGFSLIELMVAMTIGLLILTVLGTVFSRTSSGRGDLEQVSRLVENARFAADILGEDIRHAGFYGTFMPASDVVYNDAAPCTWSPGNVSAMEWRPDASPPSFPAPLQGWNDQGSTVSALNCLPSTRVAGTDVLVIRRVSTEPTLPANVDPLNVYVQASQCLSDPAPLRVSNDDAAFDLRRAACGAALAEIRRYFVRIYYVASCNVCTGTQADTIPTLKRAERVGNAWQETSLAEGVQNLQFEYAVDTNQDGVLENMTTDAGADWANVVGVRVHALMRSSEPGLTADTTPTVFNLGPNHTSVACPDRYRCRLMTSTFRLNNVAGRREK